MCILQITDFGLSNNFNEGEMMKTMCGSLVYSAPEILLQDPYSGPAADVWSLGSLVFFCIFF
jgi:serine/threonine protein kinase